MFDGTDLSVAYGSSYDSGMGMGMSTGTGMGTGMGMGSGGGGGGGISNPHQSMMQNPSPMSESPSIPKSTASHQMPPDPPYNPPEVMYAKQTSMPPQQPMYYNETFWDRLANKKWEVFKLFIMALIVMLGLSLHSVANHYLDKYIGGAFLTELQEVAVRVAYPVAIVLFIWIVKASA